MLIDIKVITNAKKNRIKEGPGVTVVYITALPVKGRANKALIKYLSAHFRVRKSDIRIIRGKKSNRKTLEITVKK